MSYALGVDIGTTFCAAAVHRHGRAEMAALDYRSPLVPSAVLLTSEGTTLVGDAALRRGRAEPERLARYFKRRLGDTVPLIVGGSPLSAEALTARLLSSVVGTVVEQQGGPPAAVAVTRPANWGSFKQDRFDQALRLAGLDDVTVLTEPEAAALAYAAAERIAPGAVVAVYDLGGGTFDATVLRREGDRFTVVGRSEGIEHLGGIDFDAAVFGHVQRSLGGALDHVDDADPAVMRALARLRDDCVDGKEALSSDSHASIPVVLPGLHHEVRLTRAEFEAMIRPTLADSIAALGRAVASAGLEPGDVDRVLLVGGSSRIPLVAQLVASAFGRPVALDAHPKHAVALGAAIVAGGGGVEATAVGATTPVPAVASPAAPATEPLPVADPPGSGPAPAEPPVVTPEPPAPGPSSLTDPAPASGPASAPPPEPGRRPPPASSGPAADGRRAGVPWAPVGSAAAVVAGLWLAASGADFLDLVRHNEGEGIFLRHPHYGPGLGTTIVGGLLLAAVGGAGLAQWARGRHPGVLLAVAVALALPLGVERAAVGFLWYGAPFYPQDSFADQPVGVAAGAVVLGLIGLWSTRTSPRHPWAPPWLAPAAAVPAALWVFGTTVAAYDDSLLTQSWNDAARESDVETTLVVLAAALVATVLAATLVANRAAGRSALVGSAAFVALAEAVELGALTNESDRPDSGLLWMLVPAVAFVVVVAAGLLASRRRGLRKDGAALA